MSSDKISISDTKNYAKSLLNSEGFGISNGVFNNSWHYLLDFMQQRHLNLLQWVHYYHYY